MKGLIAAVAMAAFLGCTSAASASTLGFSVEATSQTLGGVTDVIFHFDVIGDPDVTFTPTSAFVHFGDGAEVTVPSPSPSWTSPAFVTSYIYASAGVYSVTGVLSGYFSDDPAIQDFGNGTDVIITGFTDGSGGPTPVVPIPAALPLFVSALAGLGIAAWRRRRAAE